MKPYYVEFCWGWEKKWRLWNAIPYINEKGHYITNSNFATFQDAYSAIADCWKSGFSYHNEIFTRATDNCQARICKKEEPIDWSIGFSEIIKNYENNKKVS